MKILLCIAGGGALGAVLRYGVSGLIERLHPGPIPWGTIGVNVIGSFLIGLLWDLFGRFEVSPEVQGFLRVGLLGAFTTFSTYALETAVLGRSGDWKMASVNVLASNLLCVAAVFAGGSIHEVTYALSEGNGSGKPASD